MRFDWKKWLRRPRRERAEETEELASADVADADFEMVEDDLPEGESSETVAGSSLVEDRFNVKQLKTRSNTKLARWLIGHIPVVLVICLAIGGSIGGWQGTVRGLAYWLMFEGVLALLVKWERVPANTAWGIESLGRRVGIAREGLIFLKRWEKLSTKLNAQGERVPRFVTPEERTLILSVAEVVQDQDVVTFSVEVTLKHEQVWTDDGISAGLYGFSGDIDVHIEQSARSALADYAGTRHVNKIPSCQAGLQDYTRWYFLTMGLTAKTLLDLREKYEALSPEDKAKFEPKFDPENPEAGIKVIPPINWLVREDINGFASRFGHNLNKVEYKGIGGDYLAALAAKKVKQALADGVREEAKGDADAIKYKGQAAAEVKAMNADAEAYQIETTGAADAQRRKELAEADATRLEKIIIQMVGGTAQFAAMSAEDRQAWVDRAVALVGNLDYYRAMRESASSETKDTVLFANKDVPVNQLMDASQRSAIYKLINQALTETQQADNGAAAAASQAGS